MTKIYRIEKSDTTIKNYDHNNPNWVIHDEDENLEMLLKRFVGDYNADELNNEMYWRVVSPDDEIQNFN